MQNGTEYTAIDSRAVFVQVTGSCAFKSIFDNGKLKKNLKLDNRFKVVVV